MFSEKTHMKSDLDHLMRARDLQAIIVTGDAHDNTPRSYLSNGAHITGGYVLKVTGRDPVLIVNGMETEEAAKSGLQVLSYSDLGYAQMMIAANGSETQAGIALWGEMLRRFDVPPGKVGIYGVGSLHTQIEFTRLLSAAFPEYQFVGETGMTLFDEAYVTKDAAELTVIRSVALRTNEVMAEAWAYIGGHRAADGVVVKQDGTPLTIGDVKRFVRRALLDRDLEDTDMIFAQGRDGGFPHSRGEADMALRLGQAIVFDLFPRQLGGGYHHDMTRTWSIGYATPEVERAYRQVMDAFDIAVETFRPGIEAKKLQEAVLDYFEGAGHPTGRSQPGTSVGYVHSLGHGVGLNIHERPGLRHLSTDTLTVGNVITVEPGLYYPEQGFGVRIEDTLYISESGELISLTDFHKDLVLPLQS
jgi:Xaa-Pro aminopeptidase